MRARVEVTAAGAMSAVVVNLIAGWVASQSCQNNWQCQGEAARNQFLLHLSLLTLQLVMFRHSQRSWGSSQKQQVRAYVKGYALYASFAITISGVVNHSVTEDQPLRLALNILLPQTLCLIQALRLTTHSMAKSLLNLGLYHFGVVPNERVHDVEQALGALFSVEV